MHQNGITHLIAQNDMDGVIQILNWISYIPKKVGAPLPILPSLDPIDRCIDVDIPSGSYDPRILFTGQLDENDYTWKSGFFDKDSFTETLAGWSKSIIVGRARLGGIPVGVISVETRITEEVVLADPAMETSQEQKNIEAGQHWYPHTAFKTAQAIQDFNNGEQLPLFLFANWKGFAGGQSDMYKAILKFGCM